MPGGHLKSKNENNSTKTLAADVPYIGLESLEFSLYRNLPGWLELPLTGTNFHGTFINIETYLAGWNYL